jgi:hypothetical protein
MENQTVGQLLLLGQGLNVVKPAILFVLTLLLELMRLVYQEHIEQAKILTKMFANAA